MQLEPAGVINNCDLILKWATLRFFDANPQSLNRTLEVILSMLTQMETVEEKLYNIDVDSFLPYLLQKSGDSDDLIRNFVYQIVFYVSILHVPSEIFPLILDALATKNSRQKTECLKFAVTFIEYFDLNITSIPQHSIKTIAACIAEKDANTQNAALDCFEVVWRKIGDRVFTMVGNLPAKEKTMLDERIKRISREPAAGKYINYKISLLISNFSQR